MRCPDCGGLNPAGAEWCGQCLARFHAPDPAPAPAAVAAAAAVPAAPAPHAAPGPHAAPAPQAGPGSGVATLQIAPAAPPGAPAPTNGSSPAGSNGAVRTVGTRGAFTVTGDGISWACRLCETSNPVDAAVCGVCGSSLADTLREPEPERPKRDPNMTALVSLFLPGAGQAYLGMWAEAVSRGVVNLFALLVFFISALSGGSKVITMTFALSSFGLWFVAAHDAYREASDDRGEVLLKGRQIVYVMLGLLGLLFFLLAGSLMGARG